MTASRLFRPFTARGLIVCTLLSVGVLTVACADLRDATVLTIGNRSFSARDLRALHARTEIGQRGSLVTREDRLTFVNRVVERVLLEEHGQELVSSGRAELETFLRDAREDVMIRRLQTLEGSTAALDSVTVRAAYDRMRTSHRVRVVAFGTEERAHHALRRLRAGESLEAVVGLAGFDSWLTWTAMPDLVTDLLPDCEIGSFVGPITSRSGWLIVQVVDRRPAEVEPYESLRPRILRGLRMRAETVQVGALVDRLLADAEVRLDETNLTLLVERTRDAILGSTTTEQDPGWARPRLEEGEGEDTVAEWTGGRLTLAKYVRDLSGPSHARRSRSPALDQRVRAAVLEHVERRLLAEEAGRRGLADDWWVKRAVENARTDRLIHLAARDIQRSLGTAADGDSLIRLLRESQPQLLRREARARVLRFDLPSRELAEREAREIARAGGGLERLREWLESRDPMPGSYHVIRVERGTAGDPGIEVELFERPCGEILGPQEAFGGWVVMVCLGIEPPRDLTDEEIRATVTPAPTRAPIQDWVRLRRARVGVSIDEEALDALGPGG